mgnify:CR=1 FL=1
MNFQLEDLFVDRMLIDTIPATEVLASEIAGIANRMTSAPVGITTETVRDDRVVPTEDRLATYVLIGPTGAAGLPVEIGTRHLNARRYFKRTIDRLRVR